MNILLNIFVETLTLNRFTKIYDDLQVFISIHILVSLFFHLWKKLWHHWVLNIFIATLKPFIKFYISNYRDIHKQKYKGLWSTYSSTVVYKGEEKNMEPDSFFYQTLRLFWIIFFCILNELPSVWRNQHFRLDLWYILNGMTGNVWLLNWNCIIMENFVRNHLRRINISTTNNYWVWVQSGH